MDKSSPKIILHDDTGVSEFSVDKDRLFELCPIFEQYHRNNITDGNDRIVLESFSQTTVKCFADYVNYGRIYMPLSVNLYSVLRFADKYDVGDMFEHECMCEFRYQILKTELYLLIFVFGFMSLIPSRLMLDFITTVDIVGFFILAMIMHSFYCAPKNFLRRMFGIKSVMPNKFLDNERDLWITGLFNYRSSRYVDVRHIEVKSKTRIRIRIQRWPNNIRRLHQGQIVRPLYDFYDINGECFFSTNEYITFRLESSGNFVHMIPITACDVGINFKQRKTLFQHIVGPRILTMRWRGKRPTNFICIQKGVVLKKMLSFTTGYFILRLVLLKNYYFDQQSRDWLRLGKWGTPSTYL